MYILVYMYTYNRVTSIYIDLSKIKLFVFVFVIIVRYISPQLYCNPTTLIRLFLILR